MDTDNGGEFINHALIAWAGDKDIYFTRSRPYKSNDNAHVEQKTVMWPAGTPSTTATTLPQNRSC